MGKAFLGCEDMKVKLYVSSGDIVGLEKFLKEKGLKVKYDDQGNIVVSGKCKNMVLALMTGDIFDYIDSYSWEILEV